MLGAGGPQMSWFLSLASLLSPFLPYLWAYAYQCQTTLEQETTNEEIAQVDLELLSEALGLSKEQMCMKVCS